MVRDIQEHYGTTNLMVVSPDVGGVVRARGARQAHRGADRHLDKRRDVQASPR